ncbi:MAG: PAS domain S-box protein, partial [Acidovorax sp.]|nr:PAS domain S-box protein [Acidovorax sp.]
FQPVVPFLSPQESRLPWLLGSGGLLVTALLTALVSMLVLRRSQALDHAKETDTALRESEARLRAVFNQAAVGIAQTDSRTGRLVRMNQKFCGLLGYSAQELQQMRFQDFSEPSDLAADLEQLQRMLAGELSEYRMEKRYRRKDGSEVWVDLMVSPLRLEGQPEHHLAVVQDISKRKHMEQVLRQSEEHLRNILNHMPMGVNQVQDGKIVFRNDRHVQICGYDIREAPDVDTWWRLVMPDAHQREHAREAWHSACTAALENPDGYALHRALCARHPGHMHHAARYTALGDDVEYRDHAPLYEREARQTALALSGAQLHVNLHGYPAHEWTRPLSGYVPRGFEQWMLPKGFFLILRYHAGWQQPARALLEAVCARLQQVPELADFNARQRALYEHHAGPLPFEVLDGIACMQSQTSHDAPVTLITEFPDETVHGDAFRFAHTVQMHTALAAVQAWQDIATHLPSPVGTSSQIGL